MNYGLYISAAGMKAQQARQNVIANNLANAQTTGFKRDLAMMRSRANAVDEDPSMMQYRLPVLDKQGGGVFLTGGGIDMSQGTLEMTGNATDVALQGKGFFTVSGDAEGEKLLTRDGRFLINNDGHLVTAVGNRQVLDDAGQPIVLNPNLKVTIGRDGMISQDGGTGGVKMGVVDVSDTKQLKKLGGNVMSVTADATLVPADGNTQVFQRETEASGVDPVMEMVNMMEGQRAFDANARMISYQDTTMSEVNTIGRVA